MMQWYYQLWDEDELVFEGFHQEVVNFLMAKGYAPQNSYTRYVDAPMKLYGQYSIKRHKKENPKPNISITKKHKFKPNKVKKVRKEKGCSMTFDEVYSMVIKMLDKHGNTAIMHYVDDVLEQLEKDNIKVSVRKVKPPIYETTEYDSIEYYVLEIER